MGVEGVNRDGNAFRTLIIFIVVVSLLTPAPEGKIIEDFEKASK